MASKRRILLLVYLHCSLDVVVWLILWLSFYQRRMVHPHRKSISASSYQLSHCRCLAL